MAKTIVTHVNPDLDAICAVWLLVRFGGEEFKNASFRFVPAGERLKGEDNNIVHVDTGLGRFDHHQQDRGKENTCAARLVYEWLVSSKKIKRRGELDRLIEVVVDLDHFRDFFWAEALDKRYAFFLGEVLNGVKMGGNVKGDTELVELGMLCLNGVYTVFKLWIKAEGEVAVGISIKTKWGKALIMETSTNGVIKLALKSGFKLASTRDPESGRIRVKAAPVEEINLKSLYENLKKADPRATWFFHPSGKMILNGSTHSPDMKPSTLGVDEIIGILKRG